VSLALPAGFGRSHGETVGRYDTGLGPTLLGDARQRVVGWPSIKTGLLQDVKETRSSAHRQQSSCKEYCSRTNGPDRLRVGLVLVAVRSGHDAMARIPVPRR
jgi:hypothetical protein